MTHEQTPAQRAGFRVGDRAVVTDQNTFQLGSVIRLERDDGDHCPLWALESGKIIRCETLPGNTFCRLDRVQKLSTTDYTPQPGDYVRTANLNECEYHQVAALFMAAGAGRGEYPNQHEFNTRRTFGWAVKGNGKSELFHGNDDNALYGEDGYFRTGTELTLQNGRLVPLDQTEQVIERTDDPDTFRIDARGHAHEPCERGGVADSDLWQELHHLRRRVEKLESHGTEVPGGVETDTRPSGFYWVKNKKGRWIVAEWDSGSQTRDLLGYTHSPFVADEALDTIGPSIHPPED